MYGYTYKTTNLLNNKIYIGQKTSANFLSWYLGSGDLIVLAIKKHGEQSFKVEFLAEAHNRESLDILEKYYIKVYNSTNKSIGYNILEGGQGISSEGQSLLWKNPDIRAKRIKGMSKPKSVEGCKNMGIRQVKLWKDPDYRIAHIKSMKETTNTPGYKLAQSERIKKVWLDSEYRTNQSLKHKGQHTGKEIKVGEHLSSGTEFKKGMTPWNLNIPCSEITKRKIGAASGETRLGLKRGHYKNYYANQTA